MVIAILVLYHDWVATFISKYEGVAADQRHLCLKDRLTVLLAVFDDQKLLELQIELGVPVVSDSGDAMVLSIIDLPVVASLLSLIHLRNTRTPLGYTVAAERLPEHFHVGKVFIRAISFELL